MANEEDDHSDGQGHDAASGSSAHSKVNTRQFRLVVRNLPFSVKESAVRAAFGEFGRLEEVHVPQKIGRDGKPTGRGFGFVQYSKKKEAKDAVEKGNGMQVLGRPVAVDWALGKEFYQEVAGVPKPDRRKDDKSQQKTRGDVKAEKGAGVQEKGGQKEGGKKKDEAENEDGDQRVGKKRKAESKSEDDGQGDEKEGDLETTVFLRNIPLEATEKDVAGLMRKFGKLVFCRLVIDKTTNRHKGTAFVKYVERSGAEEAVAKGCAFTGSEEWERIQKKRDKKAAKGHLKAQLENDEKDTLSLFGRLLFCAFAVDRKSAQELEGKEIQRDRRNLYLSKEGLILEGTAAAENTPPADLQKRLRAWQDKKTKLANTNFFINPTRLSVRNIGKGVTEADLKKVFAVAAQGSKKAGDEPVKVLQARLVLDKEKLDPVTGKGESKGYGFVEFSNTEHAITALRKLNNCPIAAKKSNGGKRFMIDFSVEDARIVRQRQIKVNRMQRIKDKRAEAKKEDEQANGKPLGRGAKQRLQKRLRAEEKERENGIVDDRKSKRPKNSQEPQSKKMSNKDANRTPDSSRSREKENGKGAARGRASKAGNIAGAPKGAKVQAPANGKEGKPQKRKREEQDFGGDDEVRAALKDTGFQKRGAEKTKMPGNKGNKGNKAKHQGSREDKDDFDKLVKSYSSKLFGGQSSEGTGRWFD